MNIEQVIAEIINNYGSYIVSGVVIIVLTISIMDTIKKFAINLVNYISVKMSNLGYNAMIYWNHKLYKVSEIKFTEIVITDEKVVIFIPIELWIRSVKEYPVPGLNQFKDYMWDGIDRRKEEEKK